MVGVAVARAVGVREAVGGAEVKVGVAGNAVGVAVIVDVDGTVVGVAESAATTVAVGAKVGSGVGVRVEAQALRLSATPAKTILLQRGAFMLNNPLLNRHRDAG